MRSVVAKWGNSLGVRLPREAALALGLDSGSAVEVEAKGGVITLRRADPTLEDLLEGITPDNLHGETGTGPAVGNEVW